MTSPGFSTTPAVMLRLVVGCNEFVFFGKTAVYYWY